MGEGARQAFEKHFDDKVFFEYVIENCLQIKKKQFIPESIFFNYLSPPIAAYFRFRNKQLVSIRSGFRLLARNPQTFFRKVTSGTFGKFIK